MALELSIRVWLVASLSVCPESGSREGASSASAAAEMSASGTKRTSSMGAVTATDPKRT
jgi:hypothetical protein